MGREGRAGRVDEGEGERWVKGEGKGHTNRVPVLGNSS